MSTYVVRIADLDSIGTRTAYQLWALRESVFVVEQQCVYQELDGRDLEPTTRHLWVVDSDVALAVDSDAGPDVPVGYLRLLDDDGGQARIGRVLVTEEHRGHGVAALLMRAALEAVGDRPSVLAAQSHLAGWYARFGYTRTGPDFVDDGILHTPMRRG